MGSKLRKQAEALGLTKQLKTNLYAQPRKVRITFWKRVPDVADRVRDYINLFDPSFSKESTGVNRFNTSYFLSSKAHLYVEVVSDLVGFMETNTNTVVQINIFSNDDTHTRGIAKVVNQIFEEGMLPHINWQKIESRFKVNKEDCIATWKALLS